MKHLKELNRKALKAYQKGEKELFHAYVKAFCKANNIAEDEVFIEREESVPFIKRKVDLECISIGYCSFCKKWRDGYEIFGLEICMNCKLKEDLTEENRKKLTDLQKSFRPTLSLFALKTKNAPTVKKRIKQKIDRHKL